MKCNLSSVFNLYQALKRKEKKYFMKVISFPGALAKGFIFLLFQRKKPHCPEYNYHSTACSEAKSVDLYCTFCKNFTETYIILTSVSPAC